MSLSPDLPAIAAPPDTQRTTLCIHHPQSHHHTLPRYCQPPHPRSISGAPPPTATPPQGHRLRRKKGGERPTEEPNKTPHLTPPPRENGEDLSFPHFFPTLGWDDRP